MNYSPGSFVEAVMQDAPAILGSNLPEDPALLQAMIRELLTTNQQLQRRSDQLEHRLDQLLKRLYGPRADKLNPDQASLFDEPPPEPLPPLPEPAVEAPARQPTPGHGRRSLPTNLRRERVVIDIPEAQKLAVGGAWVRIGEEISEKLDYTPSSLFVRQIVRPKYVVRFPHQPDQLHIAGLPPEALPKLKAAPGLVADIIISKLVDHLPLYRQEKRYARQGVELSRSTLCGWLAEAAEVLTPLYARLKARVLSAKVVHTDDTPVPVQDPSREHCRTGRIWDYVSEYGVVYDATEDHCRDGPATFLNGFQGYLQCDAYAGYDEIFAQSRGKIIEVACWAHARRKFVEAEKTSPQLAHEAVARIKALYAIEHEAKGLDAVARAALRQQKATPLLDAMKKWLDREQRTALPKTPIAEAITYALNQWAALNVYLSDGNLSIDNNAAERAVKPFAIGRKNSYDLLSRVNSKRRRRPRRRVVEKAVERHERRNSRSACIDGRSDSYSGIGCPMMRFVERAASLWMLWSKHIILDEDSRNRTDGCSFCPRTPAAVRPALRQLIVLGPFRLPAHGRWPT